MRIGMILDKTFPPDSRVENEAISLIAAGHQVFLFCLRYKKNEPENKVINGIEVRRYKSNKLEYKFSALSYTFSVYRKLMQPKIEDFIKRNRIEALHIHDMTIAESVLKANKHFGLPTVLDLHENRPEIMRHYGHVKSIKGRLLINPDKWDKKQKELIEKVDKVILVTEEAKKEALTYGGKNPDDIVVVPNTVHPDIYDKYKLDQKLINRLSPYFVILYLGDTGLRRGTDTAVRGMTIIREKIKNARLVLVGNNKTEDHVLRDLVKSLSLGREVIFEGWQDVSLFPSYVEASDICISPLKRNLHHDTTYANKIFQYMAIGKPVVVSDSTAQAMVIKKEECGLVHQANNPEDFALKVLQLHEDKFLADKLAVAGKEAVQHRWNWLKTSTGLIDLYCQLK